MLAGFRLLPTTSYIAVGMEVGGASVVTEDTLVVKQTHMMMVATKSPREKDVTNVTANVIPTAVAVLMFESKMHKCIGSLARDFHIGFDPDYEFN